MSAMMDVEEFDAYEIGVATIKEGAPIVVGVQEGVPRQHRWASMAKKHNWIDTHNWLMAKKQQLDQWSSEEKNLFFTDDRYYTVGKTAKIFYQWINTISVKHNR
jgi:hypothetical protein